MPTQDQIEAFRLAGVPRKYVDRNLGSMGEPAVELLAYVTSPEFKTAILNGQGVYLVGDDALCEEAIYHLCKSTMIRSINALAITPIGLLEALNAKDTEGIDEVAEAIWTTQAFFLVNFDDTFHETNPLSPKDRYNIEDFLIGRIKDNHAVSVQMFDYGRSAWWSPRLMRWIMNNSRRFAL